MIRGRSSSKRDKKSTPSRLNDNPQGVAALLRDARQRKQLSQQNLAKKIGLRQRQISDLERGTTDSRLSTIQNVSRALDLELTLIPRHLIPAVQALQRTGTDAKRPLYALDDEPGPEDTESPSDRVEVGDTSNIRVPGGRSKRAAKG